MSSPVDLLPISDPMPTPASEREMHIASTASTSDGDLFEFSGFENFDINSKVFDFKPREEFDIKPKLDTKIRKSKGSHSNAAVRKCLSPAGKSPRKSPRKSSLLEGLQPMAYPTSDGLESAAATRAGRNLIRQGLRATDRQLIKNEDGLLFQLVAMTDGSGDGWRYLFQRARHFRGEGRGRGKWGALILQAESVRKCAEKKGATAAIKASALSAAIEQAEVDLLRAVMKSLRWKDVATHPQLHSENERNKTEMAALVEHGKSQTEMLQVAEGCARDQTDEIQRLRDQISVLTRTTSFVECTEESLVSSVVFDVEGLPMPPSLVDFTFMSETTDDFAIDDDEMADVSPLPAKKPKAKGRRSKFGTKKKPKKKARRQQQSTASKCMRAATISPAVLSGGEEKTKRHIVGGDDVLPLSYSDSTTEDSSILLAFAEAAIIRSTAW